MQIELLGVNQKLNFRTKQVSNMLCLRLPIAGDIEVAVDDATAQQVINAFFKAKEGLGTDDAPLPAPAPLPNGAVHLVEPAAAGEDEEEAPFVFGSAPPAANGPITPSSELPPPPPPPRRAAARIEKDSLGYPVVRDAGAVDASRITAGEDPDEDGVGQV